MSSFLHRLRRFSLLHLLLSGTLAAAPLSGTVTNRTNNKPSHGDDVVLIRLAQGMQEAARTKTDARGHYTLDVPDEGLHLVRVTHDKANYFRPVQPGVSTVDVDVFNAAAEVKGIAAEADVLRVQTDASGGALKVVENFFLKNDSDPPMTQFSDKPFDFYLPAGAVIEGSAALAPGGMPVQASPVPLKEPNHYTFIFPIRPGETRFQITYHLPYDGKATLAPRPGQPTDTIAVMLPKSMQFKAAAGSPYSAVTDEVNAQTYVARHVEPSQQLAFTLSGSGQLPRDTQAGAETGAANAGNEQAGASPGGAPDQTKFGGGLGNPVDPGATNDPWAKYRWWILGGLGLTLAAGAGVLLRRTPNDAPAPAEAPPAGLALRKVAAQSHSGMFAVLKEEMFQLESDRLRGSIPDSEYQETKAALEVLLRRVLGRDDAVSSVSSGRVETASSRKPAPEVG